MGLAFEARIGLISSLEEARRSSVLPLLLSAAFNENSRRIPGTKAWVEKSASIKFIGIDWSGKE